MDPPAAAGRVDVTHADAGMVQEFDVDPERFACVAAGGYRKWLVKVDPAPVLDSYFRHGSRGGN
jgi:hypothetical protein